MARRLVGDPTTRGRPARRVHRPVVAFRCQDCALPASPPASPPPAADPPVDREPVGAAPFHRLPCLRADHRHPDQAG